MGQNSKIEWTDHTFNPWMGCTKVSEACKFCYAESFTGQKKMVEWVDKAPRRLTVGSNWLKPRAWDKKAQALDERHKVFCASLADIFDDHPSIQQSWRDALWLLIRNTPNLDWLLLTKRPENYQKFLPADWGDGYHNVWLGISVENQQWADERIPVLAKTPAKVRFMSCEPLLGDIMLTTAPLIDSNTMLTYGYDIHWCIIGGESGPVNKIRKLDVKSVELLIKQCDYFGIKVFFKQLGTVLAKYTNQQHSKGADFREYPNEFKNLLRREVPGE